MAHQIFILATAALIFSSILFTTSEGNKNFNPQSNEDFQTSAVLALSNLLKHGSADQMIRFAEISHIASEYLSSEETKKLTNILLNLENNKRTSAADENCRLCTTVVSVLKEILGNRDFDDILGPLFRICYVLFSDVPNETRRQEICNGSITIQGPHVAAVISSNISSEKICEYQNSCNLPPVDKTVSNKPLRGTNYDTPKLRTSGGSSRSFQESQSRSSRGISREELSELKANSLKIVQLTDIHIDVRYHEGSIADCGLPICCLEAFGPGTSGHYGDYNCNIPPRTIELFLQKVASDVQPDLILYTGDISGSRVWDESLDEILNCTLALTDALGRTLPGKIVYPTMGNHEMFPTNLFYRGLEDVVYLMNKLTEWWSPIAGFSPEQQNTFRTAAYYSIVDPGTGIRIITYNSEFMYTGNWYNVFNFEERSEAEEMISFIERELASASSKNETVILLGHHPPNSGDYLAVYANWYKSLVLQYKDTIILQLSGHRHNDNFHLIPDSDGNPVSMMYLGSAVTAGGTKNPAIRVYYFDPVSNEIIDYDQYYLDMKTEPDAGNARIELLYSARSEYDLPDLSPQSWSDLVERMEYNDTLFMMHYNNYYIHSRENLQCNANCTAQYICNLRHITWQEATVCYDNYVPPSVTDNTISTSSTTPANGSTISTISTTPANGSTISTISTTPANGSTISTSSTTPANGNTTLTDSTLQSTTIDLIVGSSVRIRSSLSLLIAPTCFYIARVFCRFY